MYIIAKPGHDSFGRKQTAYQNAMTVEFENAVTFSSSVSPEAHRYDAIRGCVHKVGKPRVILIIPHLHSFAYTNSGMPVHPAVSVCQKTCFLTDCQRSKEPLRQTTRSRRRTDGTVGSELCSKSKSLAQQAFSPLIRQKSEIFATFPVCGAQNFLFAVRSQNFDRGTRLCPALSATGGAGQRGPRGKASTKDIWIISLFDD